jgi:hypothetical protein
MPTDIDMRGTEPNTSFSSLKQIDAGELNVGYAEVGPGDGPAVIARGAGRHCGCHPAPGLGAGILRAERSTGLEALAFLGSSCHWRQGRWHRCGAFHGCAGRRKDLNAVYDRFGPLNAPANAAAMG